MYLNMLPAIWAQICARCAQIHANERNFKVYELGFFNPPEMIDFKHFQTIVSKGA